MEENFDVFDFSLSEDDLSAMATLDRGESSFMCHSDPSIVEWFAGMAEVSKEQ